MQMNSFNSSPSSPSNKKVFVKILYSLKSAFQALDPYKPLLILGVTISPKKFKLKKLKKMNNIHLGIFDFLWKGSRLGFEFRL